MNFSSLISLVEFWQEWLKQRQTSGRRCQVRPGRRFDLVYMYSFTTQSFGSFVPRSTLKDERAQWDSPARAECTSLLLCASPQLQRRRIDTSESPDNKTSRAVSVAFTGKADIYVLIASLILLGINWLHLLLRFCSVDEVQSVSFDDLQPLVNEKNLVSGGWMEFLDVCLKDSFYCAWDSFCQTIIHSCVSLLTFIEDVEVWRKAGKKMCWQKIK